MLDVLTLSLSLALGAAPATLSPVPAAEAPAPVQCADANLSGILAPSFLSVGDIGQLSVTCNEDCDALPDISCSGNTCSAVSRNCPGQRGYVVCDGVYKYCSEPCPVCTDGNIRIVFTGQCCSACDGTGYKDFQKCVNGQWVTQSTFCGPAPGHCPLCP